MASRRTKGEETNEQADSEPLSSLFVGSVAKAFRVLQAFDAGHRSLPLVQIASLSGLDASATQRFVYTLMTLGFLRKDPHTRHYSLSPKVLHLGTSYLRAEGLAGRATPYVRRANEEAGETVSLLELDGTDIIHVIRYSAPGSINMKILIGSRSPAFVDAGGRVMLAHMPKDELAALIARSELVAWTKFTITDAGELQDRLAKARADGYAVVEQERMIDDVTVAAPVFSSEGSIVAAVCFNVPLSRWRQSKAQKRLIRIALDTARAISGARSAS